MKINQIKIGMKVRSHRNSSDVKVMKDSYIGTVSKIHGPVVDVVGRWESQKPTAKLTYRPLPPEDLEAI
jgi:F0F1-type ATP synthase alpha subunit